MTPFYAKEDMRNLYNIIYLHFFFLTYSIWRYVKACLAYLLIYSVS